jgi:nucleotidyltransferase substrate binding protein (TIGR01987 family)
LKTQRRPLRSNFIEKMLRMKFPTVQERVWRRPFKFGLIQDDLKWLEMPADRNETVHTYDEKTADRIYDRLKGYLTLFQELRDSIEKKLVQKDRADSK